MNGFTDYIHSLLDWVLTWLSLIQQRQVGWQTFDRKSGEFKREQQPLLKKLKLLLLFNPLMEWLDQTHLIRLWTHEKNLRKGILTSYLHESHRLHGYIWTD